MLIEIKTTEENKMSMVLLLKGLPASGKSSFAKAWVQENPEKRKRLNKDDMRSMLYGGFGAYKYSRQTEEAVLQSRDNLLKMYIQQGYDVVIDDTNLHYKHPRRIAEICSLFGATYQEKHFDVSLDECLKRDALRVGAAKVGKDVITEMYNRYVQNGKWRHTVEFESLQPIEQDKSLPPVFICDIDGTVAKINPANPRSHYDMTRVDEDLQKQDVVDTISMLQDYMGMSGVRGSKVIFFSGRTDDGRELTEKWLDKHAIFPPGTELYMREVGDQRRDYIVKKEMFDKYVKNRYCVIGVFDDRDQCVELWRKLGLQTFQVNWGSF